MSSMVTSGVYIRKPDKKKRKIVVIVALLVVVVFSLAKFSDGITNTSLQLTRPFQAAVWSVGDSVFNWALSIVMAGNLKRETDLLRRDNERLIAEISGLTKLREENDALRQVLELGADKNFDLKMASIWNKDILSDTIIINKGANDGVVNGMPVITEDMVVVGKISEIFDDFSRVTITTNKESAFEVEVQERNLIGLVRGLGGSAAKLTLIPKDKEIAKGDVLITTSISGSFPQGLFIGIIGEIKDADSESFQEAEITPLFNIRRLKRVFVITNQKQAL